MSHRGGSASLDEFGEDCRGRASFPMRVRPTLVGRRVGGGLGWRGEARRAAGSADGGPPLVIVFGQWRTWLW